MCNSFFLTYSTIVWIATFFAYTGTQSVFFNSSTQVDFKTLCTNGLLMNDTVIINSVVDFSNVSDAENLTFAKYELQKKGKKDKKQLFFQKVNEPCQNSARNAYNCTKIDEHVVYFSLKFRALPDLMGAQIIGTLQTKFLEIMKEKLEFPKFYETTDVIGDFSVNGQDFSNNECSINVTERHIFIRFACESVARPCLIEMILNSSKIISGTNVVNFNIILTHQGIFYINIIYGACRLDQKVKYFRCVIRPGFQASSIKVMPEFISTGDSTLISLIIGIAIPISILIILIGLFLIYRFKCRKDPINKGNGLQFKIAQSRQNQIEMSEKHTEHELRTSEQVDLMEIEGWTALMLASAHGNTEIVKQLVEAGTNINDKNRNGWTALMFAARKGHVDIIKYLISQNADVHIKEDYGWSALTIGAKKGNIEIVREISEKIPAGYRTIIKEMVRDREEYEQFDKLNSHNSSVFEMGLNDSLDETSLLLEQCANGETITSNEGNASNDDESIECEIENEPTKEIVTGGAKVSTRLVIDLVNAAKKGNKSLVSIMLSEGVQINSKTEDGLTPLMVLSQEGNAEGGMKLLLSCGANIDITTDDKGLTALMYACHEGHTKTAKLLIEEGADVNIRDKQGWTALIHAVKDEHNDIASLLIKGKAVETKSNTL